MSDCETCGTIAWGSDTPMHGVLIVTSEETGRQRVEACDECKVYPDDKAAAVALEHECPMHPGFAGARLCYYVDGYEVKP